MKISSKWRPRILLLSGLSAGVLLSSTVAVAMSLTATAPTTVTGSSVTQVRVVRQGPTDPTFETTGVAWQNVSGAKTSVTVPTGTSGLILTRFTASSFCANGGAFAQCEVRILVGGVPADPGRDDLWWDIPYEGASWGALGIDRSRGPLNPGTYVVQVQARFSPNSLSTTKQFWLRGWHLTVERIKV